MLIHPSWASFTANRETARKSPDKSLRETGHERLHCEKLRHQKQSSRRVYSRPGVTAQTPAWPESRSAIIQADMHTTFNLDAMATICQSLSTADENLWNVSLAAGRGIGRAMEYMYPYIKDKKTWPLKPDVMYDAEWPMRQNSLLFAGRALGRSGYIELGTRLPADSTVDEVLRNFFICCVLWLE
jgi:hypothetical protein